MTGERRISVREGKLLADVRGIIEDARRTVYAGVAAVQLEHNWKIGRRIVEEEQGGKARAEYAKRTIAELSAHCARNSVRGIPNVIFGSSESFMQCSPTSRFCTRVCRI